MRKFLAMFCLAGLVPASAQAQVQFVPYNPALPPFQSVTFTRDLLPPILVNPVPQSQVFVVVDFNDLLVRRTIIDAAGPAVAPSLVAAPVGVAPVVTETNYAINAAIASVLPPLMVERSVVQMASIPQAGLASNERPPIALASIKAVGRDPNDPRYPGWFVLAEADQQERMWLTPAQKAEVEKAVAEKKAGGIRTANNDSDEDNRRFMSTRRDSRERFLRMLTPAQQQMWTALTGDPYEFRPNY